MVIEEGGFRLVKKMKRGKLTMSCNRKKSTVSKVDRAVWGGTKERIYSLVDMSRIAKDLP